MTVYRINILQWNVIASCGGGNGPCVRRAVGTCLYTRARRNGRETEDDWRLVKRFNHWYTPPERERSPGSTYIQYYYVVCVRAVRSNRPGCACRFRRTHTHTCLYTGWFQYWEYSSPTTSRPHLIYKLLRDNNY